MRIKKLKPYNLVRPHPGLGKYVSFYNVVFPDGQRFTPQYTLMPQACGTLSLAFHGDSFLGEMWGASITPTQLGTEPDQYSILLLIQFSAYGLYQITRQNQSEFTDKRVLLEEIDDDLYKELWQAMERAETVKDLTDACDCIFYRRRKRS